MQFELDIANFIEKTNAKADVVIRKVALDLFRLIVLKNPVGNPLLWKHRPPPGYIGGRSRGNWQISIDVPADSYDEDRVDQDGELTINRAALDVRKATARNVVWITNNLPYILALEYGHSTQAPNGMVRVSIQELSTALENAV